MNIAMASLQQKIQGHQRGCIFPRHVRGMHIIIDPYTRT